MAAFKKKDRSRLATVTFKIIGISDLVYRRFRLITKERPRNFNERWGPIYYFVR